MRRHSAIFAAAVACGLSVATTRALEDAERDGEDVLRPKSPPKPEAKVHKHEREIARRLRQKARREAKARGEA